MLIQQGSIYHRVHACQLQHVKADYISNNTEKVDVNDSPNSSEKVLDLEQDADLGHDVSITESSIEAQNDTARPVPSCTNQLHVGNSGSKSAGKIVLPKKNQSVMFKYPDSDWTKIKVTGRAGKATGKVKNCLNTD